MLAKVSNKILIIIIIIGFLSMLSSNIIFGCYEEDSLKKILILASYDIDNQWELSVIEGFKNNLGYSGVVKVEFLDSKASDSDIYDESISNLLNLKYKNDGIDCVLAVDDEAFNLVRKNLFREESFLYKKPIVFVGVNNYVALSKEESRYITGLMEYQDDTLMINTILEEDKRIDDIYILLDKSIYSNTIKENIKALTTVTIRPFVAHIIEESYLKNVLDQLNEIDEKSAALYLCGTYIGDKKVNLSSQNIVSTLKNKTKAPLYTKLINYVEAGAIGGIINDGEKLGRTASILMNKFLNQFDGNEIIPIYSTYNTSVFNYKVMREYDINPWKLPNNTIYINKGPFDLLLPNYMINILASILAIVCTFILFIIYLYYENKKKAQKNRLLLIESEERNKVKTDFIITLSHELRTPLNIIISSSNLLMKQVCNNQFEIDILREKLGFIIKNSNRLLRYINNIIDSSKLEIGYMGIKFNNVNIVYLVEETTLTVIEAANKYGVELIFNTEEEEIITAIDEEKICRIILILLSNALKFSKAGGSIYVDMEREENNIKIKVIDNGIGINESVQEHIFEKFKREQSVSDLKVNQEGSGLGLYIAKGFVELHNGTIEVKSQANKGSEFIITIPIVILDGQNQNSVLEEEELKRIAKLELSDI